MYGTAGNFLSKCQVQRKRRHYAADLSTYKWFNKQHDDEGCKAGVGISGFEERIFTKQYSLGASFGRV